MKKKAFRDLRAEWYKKLKDSGFEDIEDTKSPREMLLCWHNHKFKRTSQAEIEIKTAYYQFAQEMLTSYKFEREIERQIWELHANGASIRDISNILRDRGTPLHRSSVFRALKKLIKNMKLGQNIENAPRIKHRFGDN